MAKIPGFMLKRLYVKGSLRNTEEGFEFDIKNDIMTGSLVRALPIKLNGKELPIEDCSFIVGDKEVESADVSPENPVLMEKGEAVTVKVGGRRLGKGKHTIQITSVADGIGQIQFDFKDTIR